MSDLAGAEHAEEARLLEILLRVGADVAAELDLERAVQIVTDAATELSGAAFGSFFYNVLNEKGESYTLYTLSGAPREAFAKFPMPRNTAIFGPTFAGEGVVRSDDITKDPRYGLSDPHFGQPKGHLPVCSYLAAPVMSRSGEVLGGLFFGHPEPGVFTAQAERLVVGIAAYAAIAIDNARLYEGAQREIQRRAEVEAALRKTQEQLQSRITERGRQVEATSTRLKESERDFGLLVDSVTDYAIYMLDPEGVVSSWNSGAQRIKGYSADEIVGQPFARFYTEEDRERGIPARNLARAAQHGRLEDEGWRVRKDGTQFRANVVIDPIWDGDRLVGFAKVTRDVTERVAAEEKLRQAQKMDTIGQLTGGVAHDFNNLLTIISGSLETLQRQIDAPVVDRSRLRRPLAQAVRGAERAAALTQRLLAFARRTPLEPRPVDVNRIVASMSELLRRTLGEQVSVETVQAGGLWPVHADPNQLENAILNLAVNARDAMPGGGKLTVETANAYLDEAYAAAQSEVSPGQYVVICVTDTGAGMSREVRAQAFEPFFTTKDVGHGTGLGLSQVYGFVKQSGGHVQIYSELGQGTAVKIYLPRLMAETEESEAAPAQMELPRGDETELILVVEDDEDVRAHTVSILDELGYSVLQAERGDQALELLQRQPGVTLLFTDVGLPGGMTGRQLADQARQLRPDLKVLFTTGYAKNAIVHDGRLDAGVELITKPFTFGVLAARLREILDAGARGRCVLVVDDESLVRLVAADQIHALGLTAEEAGTATEAINKAKLSKTRFAAALVDLGLPDRRGDALAAELRAIDPELPIIIASGQSEEAVRSRFSGDSRVAVLPKPFSMAQMQACFHALGIRTSPS